MTATYTERYIAATVKSLRPEAQDDVRAELEASIADAVDARIQQGERAEDAERAVLNELGDPGILAAGYADRPLHLIGPRYYLAWSRLLRLLLWIVPISVMGAVALGLTISDAPAGTIIGESISTGLTVIAHLCFWVTLVFVVLERTGADTGLRWNVDQLPEPEAQGVGRADLIGSLVFLVVCAGAIIWDRFRGFVRPDGEALPILDPQLWPWATTALFLLLGAEGALAIMVYARRRWTTTFAIINTALAVVFVGGALTLLVRGELINPELLAHIAELGGEGWARGDARSAEQGGTFRILAVLLGFAIVGVSTWDAVDGWRKTIKAGRE